MEGEGAGPTPPPQEREAKPRRALQRTSVPSGEAAGTWTCAEVPVGVQVSPAAQVAAVQDQHGVLVLLQLGLRVPHAPQEGHLARQGQAQLLPEVRRWGLQGGDEPGREHWSTAPHGFTGSAPSPRRRELGQGEAVLQWHRAQAPAEKPARPAERSPGLRLPAWPQEGRSGPGPAPLWELTIGRPWSVMGS